MAWLASVAVWADPCAITKESCRKQGALLWGKNFAMLGQNAMHQGFGKLILLGEHAVIHGYPALCGALPNGVVVRTGPGKGRVRIPSIDVATLSAAELLSPPVFLGAASVMDHAYWAILKRLVWLGCDKESIVKLPFDFFVSFDIAPGAGLGGSAAFSSALSRALLAALDIQVHESATFDFYRQKNPKALDVPHHVFGLVQEAETVFHGMSSGLDAMMSLHKGFGVFCTHFHALFRDAAFPPERFFYVPQEGDEKQTKTVFFHPIANRSIPICIGYSGQAKDTKTRVQRVSALLQANPQEIQHVLGEIGQCVEKGMTAVLDQNWEALGEAMNQNHMALQRLEVSTSQLDDMCNVAKQVGALGAKVTGGGGGGCVIALAPGREQQVQAAWKAAGYASQCVVLGESTWTGGE